MSKSLELFRKEMNRIWSLQGQIDWSDKIFTPQKAYILAVFSKTAYLEIPDYELAHHRLVKIIPCLTYQELHARGTHFDMVNFVRSADFGDTFVVVTDYIVAVVIIRHDVIIIALRGTRPLYLSDWMIDLQVTRTKTNVNNQDVMFHSGFYSAITDFIEQIAPEIIKRTKGFSAVPPIYVVGHSLGGALAAMVRALDGMTCYSRYRFGSNLTININTHSSYSFGMPRYGDTRAVTSLKSPFHVYNDRDIVPGLPLIGMGFDNVPVEYRLSGRGTLDQLAQDRQELKWLFSRIHLASGIRHHFIERYIRRLGVVIGIYDKE